MSQAISERNAQNMDYKNQISEMTDKMQNIQDKLDSDETIISDQASQLNL